LTSPTRLFLLRHGEVESRYHRVFGGRIDMELSPHGHHQACRLADYLRPTTFDAIYVSPMKRAQQTLIPLKSHCRRAPTVLPGLCEVDFGAWTGLGWQQVREQFQVEPFEWLHKLEQATIPEAESVQQFRDRVEPCLQQILREHSGQTVAVVCHGGVIRMMLAILLGLPLPKTATFDIEYASLTEVHHHSHKTEIQRLNFTPWRDLA
jgi:broad specificity phosphatase PhoE